MRYALAVTAIVSIASSASSFEVDLKLHEVVRLRGYYLVGDLTVGAKARVGNPCQESGRLFMFDTQPIDPTSNFIATLKPSGHISLELSPVDYKGERVNELYVWQRPYTFEGCERLRERGFEGDLIEVDDIDGFTTYSEWAESVVQRFPLNE